MRFQAHDRLLDLLVGSNLYPSPDVCVRELIQNAWDAIQWRHAQGDDKSGTIALRFSRAQNWFEVHDNGIGMDAHDVGESLIQKGRNKLEALGGSAAEQIGFFGIGFLSVFLVAANVEILTRKLGTATGLRLVIPDLRSDFEPELATLPNPGTIVRVNVREGIPFTASNVPEALRKYVRHVDNISVEDVDTGSCEEHADTWDIPELREVTSSFSSSRIRKSRMGFQLALHTQGQTVSNSVTLCNSGFLVESRALDLLPIPVVGFSGELDLHASSLSIAMARDRFQRDSAWHALGSELAEFFLQEARRHLESGFLKPSPPHDDPEVRRLLLIWTHNLADSPDLNDFRTFLNSRILRTVGFSVAEHGPSSLNDLVARLPYPRLYVRRATNPTQVSRHIDDEGFPLQIVEELRDTLRVGALQARGFPVVESGYIQLTQQTAQGAVTVNLDELAIISRVLSPLGIQVLEPVQAPESDMNLAAMEKLPVLRSVLNVGVGLRFARIQDSQRRVVRDPSGIRYLNVNNPTIRRLLGIVPAAVSNPLRRKLLELYLRVEEFELPQARQIILQLLEMPDLPRLARAETAILTSAAAEAAVRALQKELGE